MATIIAIGNQKGGVGKSTVTMLAATALSQPPFNRSVVVIDTPRQQSISRRRDEDRYIYEGALPYDILNDNFATFQAKVAMLDDRYELIFLDVTGKLDIENGGDSEAMQALQYLDVLLIPFTAGNFCLENTLKYLRAALAVQEHRSDSMAIYGFRNMHRERSRHERALSEELASLAQLSIVPLIKTPLKRYSAFEDADTVESLYKPASSDPAHQNFVAWLDELTTILDA